MRGELKYTIKKCLSLPSKAYFAIFISGLTGFVSHAAFIWALTLSHKGGVALIYDTWPIIAVIASPLIMQKSWGAVSFKEFAIASLAILGMGFVIFSDNNINFNLLANGLDNSFQLEIIGGYILAFIGAYLTAIMVAYQGAVAEYMDFCKNQFSASLLNQLFARGVGFILSIPCYFIFADLSEPIHIEWLPVIFIGTVIMVLGTTMYIYCVLKSTKPTIHVMFYFVPFFAVIWLWLAGETTVNYGLAVGGAIILLSNIYLALVSRIKPSLDT